jgi:hypothetical protein
VAPKTEAEAREIARKLLEEAEFRRQEAEARGERFESLDEETLVKKIMGHTANSPFFAGQSWTIGTSPGGTIDYTATIHNPDPTGYSGFLLFGYLFFGPANFIQNADTAFLAVDTRFPRFFRSLSVAAGGSADETFAITFPPGISPGVYLGNFFLLLRRTSEVGNYFDRASFYVTVS